MAFNISVFNSCKFLAISVSRYTATVNSADIVISNIDSNIAGSYTAAVTYDTSGNGNINIPVSNLSAANGAFKVCVVEDGIEIACKPILLKCDIDCCLVKLTDELIDCSCDCPRCASTMAKAQKIFLLLASAQSAVEIAGSNTDNSGYHQDILVKYKKAKEICDNSCGCDC
mgnify:CR=1 FL=1|jgi:hypothetical protein|tara:strand:- start:9116 stop:9628 length:513 start_codon:yes stop_codon:yes gene_type:complete